MVEISGANITLEKLGCTEMEIVTVRPPQRARCIIRWYKSWSLHLCDFTEQTIAVAVTTLISLYQPARLAAN
jgi:hypothetical protein